jgi:ABC-type oligopeptide transport system substrate-binding subunit
MSRGTVVRLAAAMALGALLAATTGTARAAGPAVRFRAAGAGWRTLDPAKASSPLEERIALACFEPLATLDPDTGQPRPAAAEKWVASADGKTWTFTLRAGAKWSKKAGDAFEDKGPVTAKDFVDSWLRVLDPETASPSATLLDVVPGCRELSFEGIRATHLDQIGNELLALTGAGARQSIKGDDVISFLAEDGRNARTWLAPCLDPAVQKLLAWEARNPLVPAEVKKVKNVLDAEAKKARDAHADAESHVGVDRGFWAKDDKTLVVETTGPGPWLPSLVSRAALAPVHVKTVKRQRERAFQNYSFVSSGAYVLTGDLPQLDDRNQVISFKVVLTKSTPYWNAAAVPVDEIVVDVNHDLDDLGVAYAKGDLHWIPIEAFAEDAPRVLAAKAPGWKPPNPKRPGDDRLPGLAADLYSIAGRGVTALWFRCVPPFDKADTRRALAAVVDRAALRKLLGVTAPPLADRLVPSRTAGTSGTVTLPVLDPSKAKALYGAPKYPKESGWITLLAAEDASVVVEAVAKAWKTLGDDVSPYPVMGSEVRAKIAGGQWQAAIAPVVAEFDDPLAFLLGFSGSSNVAATGYFDARFDALLKAAQDVTAFGTAPLDPAIKDLADVRASVDPKSSPAASVVENARRRLLVEAEKRLLDDAVVVPLWASVETGVVKPKVRGLTGLAAWGGKGRSVLDVHPLVGAVAGD